MADDYQNQEKYQALEAKIAGLEMKIRDMNDILNKLWTAPKLETSATHIYWTDSAKTKHQLDN